MTLPVTSVARDPEAETGTGWPWDVPCVRQLLSAGLDLGPLTVLVGENGSGKSTVTEGIAQAYGLSPEGGSTGARNTSRVSESPLWRALSVGRGIGASHWGFFLRAETMHGFYSYLEANPALFGARSDPVFHEMSHGESFLELFASRRFADAGFFVLDEPESALSFVGCLALVRMLHQIAGSTRRQALVATHSPVIAATPGARILELGEWGLREVGWEELELVANWRAFLDDPQRYLRHILN